jgi:aspartate kinase
VERIEAVADRVMASRSAGNDIVVVVSAMSGEPNRFDSLG